MYEIPIRNTGFEKRRRSVGFFHVLAGLFIAANAGLLAKMFQYKSLWIIVPIYLISILSILYGITRKKYDPNAQRNPILRIVQTVTFLVLAIILLNNDHTLRSVSLICWAGVCAFLFFSERNIFKEPNIHISEAGLDLPSVFQRKHLNWSQLDNIIIRQDYITINLTDNRYQQFEVNEQVSGTEIEQIKLYCEERLKSVHRASSRDEQIAINEK